MTQTDGEIPCYCLEESIFSKWPYCPKQPIDSLKCEVTQSCPALCNPMDCSLPGSSVHVIFQARVLEWVAISFSSGSSWPRDRTQVPALKADILPSEPRWLKGEAYSPSTFSASTYSLNHSNLPPPLFWNYSVSRSSCVPPCQSNGHHLVFLHWVWCHLSFSSGNSLLPLFVRHFTTMILLPPLWPSLHCLLHRIPFNLLFKMPPWHPFIRWTHPHSHGLIIYYGDFYIFTLKFRFL